MPHKHKRNGKWTGKWLGQIKTNGERERKLFDTKAEARAWEASRRQRPGVKTPSTSLVEWITQYLEYSTIRHQPKVTNEKLNIFRRFGRHFNQDMPVAELTAGDALDYLQQQALSRSGHAANKERKNLVAAWNYGIRFISGFPNINPFLAVEEFPTEPQNRRVPTWEEFWRVVEVAEGQDRVMLLAFIQTAARRGELYRLKWSDVDLDAGTIRLTTRKRKSHRLEPDIMDIDEDLVHELKEQKLRTSGEWVFVQQSGRFEGKPYTENRGFPRDLCIKAGVEPFGCHGIRHLSATFLAKNNVPMKEIREHLRHKRLSTTEGYIHRQGTGKAKLKILRRPIEGSTNEKRV